MKRRNILLIIILLVVVVAAYIQFSQKKKYHFDNIHFKIIADKNSHPMTKNEEMALDILYNRIKNIKEACMWKMSFKFGDYGYVFEGCAKDQISDSGTKYAKELFIVRYKAFRSSGSDSDDSDYVWVMEGGESYWIFNVKIKKESGNKKIIISNDVFILELSE